MRMTVSRVSLIALAALSLGVAMAPAASAQTFSTLNGQSIRIATSLTVFEDGDDALMERLRAELTATVTPTDPLPYHTIGDIPDARTLGYGDCKSFSVAMRNMLVEQGFARDSLLLAGVLTEKGEPHMVLLIRGKADGKEVTRVYDSRVRQITTVEALKRHGYTFQSRENAPDPDAILVNHDGFDFT